MSFGVKQSELSYVFNYFLIFIFLLNFNLLWEFIISQILLINKITLTVMEWNVWTKKEENIPDV